MARWTATQAEAAKLVDFPEFVTANAGKPLMLKLVDGRIFSGTIYRSQSGNNAGRGPDGWAYYASITLETETGNIDIDFLDVDNFMQISK
jgi:hypothetical protein